MADSPNITQLTDTNFQATINAGKPVFIDFWAP